MKKFLLLILAFIVVVLLSIYIFIPAKAEISKTQYIRSNTDEAYKVLNNESSWHKWWPKEGVIKKINTGETAFFYKGYRYELTGATSNSIEMKIRSDLSVMDSRINVAKLNSDSVQISWKCEIQTGLNPGKRVLRFREAKEIKKDIGEILSQLAAFLEGKNIIPKDSSK